ncbi:MAG: hypothetical protein CTY19_15975 [Methylomonas sp.]|nr:MAG: hypothetical protein CTY19_15975 [Methylomonas sp.]
MLTKSALIIAMSLATGSAFAHGGPHFPTPTGGNPFSINLSDIEINPNGGYQALDVSTNFNNFAGIKFSVTTAGVLDLFTDDRNDLDAEAGSVLYVFKRDTIAHDSDWTLTFWNEEGPRVNPGSNHPVNGYDIPITGREPVSPVDTGSADPGVTDSFDVGTYLAFYVNGFTESVALREIGSKLSAGFDTSNVLETLPRPVDFYLRAASGSSAEFGPVVSEVPVPGAVWLMGSVLAGFGAFGRKKAKAA